MTKGKKETEDRFLQVNVRPSTGKEWWLSSIDRAIASIFYLVIMPSLMATATYHMQEPAWVEASMVGIGVVLGVGMSIGIHKKWFAEGYKTPQSVKEKANG